MRTGLWPLPPPRTIGKGDASGSSGGGGGFDPASLLVNLVAYWKLDEASGNATDSAGANTLTDNNTVTTEAGKVNGARSFAAASSESLSIVDNAALSMGAGVSFTLAGWVIMRAGVAAHFFVTKASSTTAGTIEYRVHSSGPGGSFFFDVSDGTTLTTATSTFSPIVEETWYFLEASFDASTDTLSIRVNNGAADTAAGTGDCQDSTRGFSLGRRSSAGAVFLNGAMDEWGIWKRLLTNDERNYLYNAGAGRTLP